jgi:hypothetical protein
MTARKPVIVFVAIAVLAAAGCRTAPIHNPKDVMLAPPPGTSLTMEDVSRAIWAAGKRLGWQINELRPGDLTGTLKLRSHVAVVSIAHDTSKFSITFKDGTNLLHKGDEIHRNYNNWISNLERQIQAEVASVSR